MSVENNADLLDGARALVDRAIDLSKHLLTRPVSKAALVRGGRKARRLAVVPSDDQA